MEVNETLVAVRLILVRALCCLFLAHVGVGRAVSLLLGHACVSLVQMVAGLSPLLFHALTSRHGGPHHAMRL